MALLVVVTSESCDVESTWHMGGHNLFTCIYGLLVENGVSQENNHQLLPMCIISRWTPPKNKRSIQRKLEKLTKVMVPKDQPTLW